MKILNLYAGIGGNRKLWPDSHEVVAVEYDTSIADIYKEYYPKDKVVVGDAHEFLLNHYKDFDFIWSSPPCPTHSDIRRMGAMTGQYAAMYPDMSLWQEIKLLKHFFKGKWVVENVKPYYDPIERPSVEIDRHLFWTNFRVRTAGLPKRESNHQKITGKSTVFGRNISSNKTDQRKDKILRNMVNPKIGLYLLECAVGVMPTDVKQLELL